MWHSPKFPKLAMDALSPEQTKILKQYERGEISRSKAFDLLKKTGMSVDQIRAELGDDSGSY